MASYKMRAAYFISLIKAYSLQVELRPIDYI